MADREITFRAKDSNVESTVNRLKQSAAELGRELIEDANAFATSGKQVTRYLEDEIRLLEQRNRLYEKTRTLELERARFGGEISKEDFTKRATEIKFESEEDKLQTQLLREIIDAIKGTSRQEIIHDRSNVENQIRSYQEGELKGLSPEEELKLKYQREQLATDKQQTEEERRGFTGRGIERGVGIAGGLAMSKNEIYGLAATLAVIPWVGQGLSMIGQKALGAAEQYDIARGGLVQIAGGSVRSKIKDKVTPGIFTKLFETVPGVYENLGGGGKWGDTSLAESYGYNQAQFIEEAVRTARSKGKIKDVEKATYESIALQKGGGLSQGVAAELFGLSRGDISGMTTQGTAENLIKAMQSAGVGRGGDLSMFPEFVDIMKSYGKEQLARLGRIDLGVNNRMIAGIASLSTSLTNPAVLGGVISRLQEGLISPSTPQVEALQFATLSGIMPGASLWELEKMREGGVSQPGYLRGILGRLGRMGGGEQFYRNIKNVFGLSATLSEEIGRGFETGGLDEAALSRKIQEAQGVDLSTRAKGTVGLLEESTANMENIFMDVGKSITNVSEFVIKKIDEFMKYLKDRDKEKSEKEKRMAEEQRQWEEKRVKTGVVGEDYGTAADTNLRVINASLIDLDKAIEAYKQVMKIETDSIVKNAVE